MSEKLQFYTAILNFEMAQRAIALDVNVKFDQKYAIASFFHFSTGIK